MPILKSLLGSLWQTTSIGYTYSYIAYMTLQNFPVTTDSKRMHSTRSCMQKGCYAQCIQYLVPPTNCNKYGVSHTGLSISYIGYLP